MKIVLVQCKPQNELYDSRYQSENLAMGYLASSLRLAGFSTDIVDAHLMELEPFETVMEIVRRSPDLVGFSASAQDSIASVTHVIELLRSEGYAGHVTIGGHFPTYEHQQLMTHTLGLDSVVRGEGEVTVVELARHVHDKMPLHFVDGITFRDENGAIVVNQGRKLVEDLDSLPWPDRDTMPILLEKNRRISMLASRGCYAKCSFCSIQTFFDWRPRRVREAAKVVAEMSDLYQQGVRKFKFVDDLFMDPSNKSKEWVFEFCRLIREAELTDLNLWLQVRAVCVKEDIMRELVDIGLKKIFLGLESGHAETLKRYQKEITPEQNMEAVHILKRVGVPEISIGMMIFEPDVSLQGIRENVDFLKALGTFDIRDVTGRFLPYAGTPLTEKLQNEGRIRRTSWYDIGTYDFVDSKVGQLFRLVTTYNEHAKPSLKLIYRLDGQVRKLERHFLHPEERGSAEFEDYQGIRKDVEQFIQEHGKLMLTLVENTIDAIDKELQQEHEEEWCKRSESLFKKSEEQTVELFARIDRLLMKVAFVGTEPENESIHVAEVKVLSK